MTTSWTEIRVDVPAGWQELVGEALSVGPCSTVVFGTTSVAATPAAEGCIAVRGFLPTADDTPALREELEGRLGELEAAVGDPELSGLAPSYRALPPEDYATSWRKDWKPFRVGRLVLLPPWCEDGPPRTSDIRLTIQPGGSFGSGRHATTRTCLRILDRRIRGGERVLDAGAGSGVLSVGAALLGAKSALGFDIDPASPTSATELAEDNGAADRCTFRRGTFDVLDESETAFDVVLANIYADVLQANAEELFARLAPGGWFCFSGCRIDHKAATLARLAEVGFHLDEEHVCGRWATLVGRR